jgi:4-hydroxybenzoate polyprenyltransferase
MGKIKNDIPLVVDMDGSLLKTDMLYESFVSSIGNSFGCIFKIPIWLIKGKVHLKEKLAEYSSIELHNIPCNPELLDYLKSEYAQGRRIYLASAGAPVLVESVAHSFGFFDDVFTSQDGENFSSTNKANFLVDYFGVQGFDYVGNSKADLAVWKISRKAIAVNCRHSLVKKIDTKETPIVLDKPVSNLRSIIKALRPHQWFKNVLIALPMLASHTFDILSFLVFLLAFTSFSLIASMVYVVNDLLDLNNDRSHHTKRLRPFASGCLPIPTGLFMAPLLLVFGVGLSTQVNSQFVFILCCYLLITTAYSFKLKKHAVIDVVTLAILYSIRIIAGISALSLDYSPWLLGFSLFLFLSLAIVKRVAEIHEKKLNGRTDLKGRGYQISDLSLLESMAVSSAYSAVVVYFLYVNSAKVAVLYHFPELLWLGLPLLVFWLSRVLLLTHRGHMHEDPVVFALTDKVSLITGSLFLLVVIISLVI